jgi:hypothetical protein
MIPSCSTATTFLPRLICTTSHLPAVSSLARTACTAVPCRYDFFVLESPQLPQGVRLAQVAEGIPPEELEGVIPTPGEPAASLFLL